MVSLAIGGHKVLPVAWR